MKTFAELVKIKLQEKVADKGTVKMSKVEKTGGTRMAVTILRDGINITPTIYLDPFEAEFEKGNKTLDEIIEDILKIDKENEVKENFDAASVLSKETILANVIPCLIPMNEKYLENKLHSKVLDMGVVFKLIIAHDAMGTASITLNEEHLAYANTTEDEVKRAAYENLKKDGIVKPIMEILLKRAPEEVRDEVRNMLSSIDMVPMLIVSNQDEMNGAAQILNRDLMNSILDKLETDRVYVIPSSIHECICVDANCGSKEWLVDMIRDVNNNEVHPDEVLSYSAYQYTRENGLELA